MLPRNTMQISRPPSAEQETHALKVALVECKTRLDYYRAEKDDLNADLAEADLNLMLERLAQLSAG